MAEKTQNRWLVVFGAILIQLALGALYAWSLFTKYLKMEPYLFNAAQTQAIFTTALVSFAVVMIFAGIKMKKTGPRPLVIAGAIFMGGGYILGGLFGSTFITQLIFIGLVAGAGIGMAYVVPIATSMKWFKDMEGIVVGLAVAGFGFGAIIWMRLAGTWLGIIEKYGVQPVYIIYGILFTILILIGSIWMVNPPADYAVPVKAKAAKKTVVVSDAPKLTWREMLRTSSFWTIWTIFVFTAMAGLMVIGTIALFGMDSLQASGINSENASGIAATAMVWYAIFNGLGRIVWGAICQRIGAKSSIALMALIQGVLMLSFYHMGKSPLMLILYASGIGFNFGGIFALFPSATATLYNSANVGSNYPFVFTAYGIAALVGPLLAGFIRDFSGSFLPAFNIAGTVCVLGSLLALTIKVQGTQPILQEQKT